MDVLVSHLKDPDATDRYALDWADRLDAQGVPLSDVTGWDVEVPPGLNEVHRARDGATTAVWLSGGAAGASYIVTFRLLRRHPSGTGDPVAWDRSVRVTVAQQ